MYADEGRHASDSGGATVEGGGRGDLMALMQALEAADNSRSGSLHSAQLILCCRMVGLEEPSEMLHAVMRDVSNEDGRVSYVSFVQQLAALRAGASARASVAAMHSPPG